MTPSIKRFILVSYLGSRRKPAPWWNEASTASFSSGNRALKTYHEAKLPPDELLYRLSRTESVASDHNRGFAGIVLRPGTLTMEPTGGITLGKTQAGKVSRDSVARTIVELVEVDGVGSVWLDMTDGDEGIEEAVSRVAREKVDAAEGDDIYMPRA
jgi:putative NAD(P)-binding protein